MKTMTTTSHWRHGRRTRSEASTPLLTVSGERLWFISVGTHAPTCRHGDVTVDERGGVARELAWAGTAFRRWLKVAFRLRGRTSTRTDTYASETLSGVVQRFDQQREIWQPRDT